MYEKNHLRQFRSWRLSSLVEGVFYESPYRRSFEVKDGEPDQSVHQCVQFDYGYTPLVSFMKTFGEFADISL